ncbi:MAG: hypothetical protein RBR53_11675 [Desulforegulaceae bacterium]|nr:hypothetical protein [Desulforegulaceae bacterium]
MSISTRKIIHYSIKIENNKTGNVVDAVKLQECFRAIMKLKNQKRVYDNPSLNRFHLLFSYTENNEFAWGYFKSAKYNHRPDLIDKENLSERSNPKRMTEGEGEKTHFAMGVKNNEILLLLEVKRDGVQINTFQTYLEPYLKKINQNYIFNIGLSITGDFNEKLKELERVSSVEIYTPYIQVSDSFGSKIPIDQGDIQEDAIVTFKAQRAKSLKKTAKAVYNIFSNTKKDEVSRVRVYGKTYSQSTILIDTNRLKDHDTIKVELDDNGQVMTQTILPAIKQLVEEIL